MRDFSEILKGRELLEIPNSHRVRLPSKGTRREVSGLQQTASHGDTFTFNEHPMRAAILRADWLRCWEPPKGARLQ